MATQESKMMSEKLPEAQEHGSDLSIHTGDVVNDDDFKAATGILARLLHWEAWLDRKFGVEPHGPRRVTPDKKKPPKTWMMFFMWSSTGAYALASITTGMIPWEYGLSLTQAILVVIFGTFLGAAAAVSFTSSMPFQFDITKACFPLHRDGVRPSALQLDFVRSLSRGTALDGGHPRSLPS